MWHSRLLFLLARPGFPMLRRVSSAWAEKGAVGQGLRLARTLPSVLEPEAYCCPFFLLPPLPQTQNLRAAFWSPLLRVLSASAPAEAGGAARLEVSLSEGPVSCGLTPPPPHVLWPFHKWGTSGPVYLGQVGSVEHPHPPAAQEPVGAAFQKASLLREPRRLGTRTSLQLTKVRAPCLIVGW